VKRICLLGAVIAGLLTIGGATASASTAAGKKKPAKPTFVTTKLTCNLDLTTQAPSGSAAVTQGAADGTQFGKAECGSPLASGVEANSFSQDDAGDWSGPYQQYFDAGTIYGDFMMTPNDTAPPTTTSFTTASFTGTLTVKNGKGIYKDATGTGTLTCATTDAAHYTCTEKLKLILPAPTTTATKTTKTTKK
jgi:hypothetical protein